MQIANCRQATMRGTALPWLILLTPRSQKLPQASGSLASQRLSRTPQSAITRISCRMVSPLPDAVSLTRAVTCQSAAYVPCSAPPIPFANSRTLAEAVAAPAAGAFQQR